MIVAEYAGLVDWVKEKLGIGYVKLKDYTDLNLMREHTAVLKGLGIRYYTKCSGGVCSIFVEKDKANQALQAISSVVSPTIRKSEMGFPVKLKILSNIPLLVGITAIPLLVLVAMRLRK